MNKELRDKLQKEICDLLSVPASFDVPNRMSKLPGAIAGAVVGGPSASDLNAIRVTPLVGNAYGFGYMWNNM